MTIERRRVWAPFASDVRIILGGGVSRGLERLEGGWWQDTVLLPVGCPYWFALDGSRPLPDPRSDWQPESLEGPSCAVDHEEFRWSDAGWTGPQEVASSVIYELHVGSFSPQGDFAGVEERIGHLKALGVTHVELMPVAEFPGRRGWGYDGVFLYAPHHAYGGPEGLKRLVDACHRANLGVLLDVVYNHLGPGSHLHRFGPYLTDRYSTPWGGAVNLDGPGSDEVRRFFIDNALMWLRDYHIDGLRIDAVHAFFDTSAMHFLEQLRNEVEQLSARLGRGLQLIAESDLNDPRIVARQEVGGYGLDAQWSDDFHHSLHAVLTGEITGYYEDFGSLGPLATCLRAAWVYQGQYSRHRQRMHGRVPKDIPSWRFLGYLQNHDQIGNRAIGDRLSASLSLGRLLAGASLVACAPFVPMVFMGEEWGCTRPFPYFCDHPDPEFAEHVRQSRRGEFAAFGWDPESIPDPQAKETADSAILDWGSLSAFPHTVILQWWTELLALRRRRPELTAGALDDVFVSYDDKRGWLVFQRGGVGVAVNLGSAPVRVAAGRGQLLLKSNPATAPPDPSGFVLLPPDSVVVVESTH